MGSTPVRLCATLGHVTNVKRKCSKNVTEVMRRERWTVVVPRTLPSLTAVITSVPGIHFVNIPLGYTVFDNKFQKKMRYSYFCLKHL